MIRFRPDVIRTHKSGVNVLYANGSAQYIQLKNFDKAPWNTVPDETFSTSDNDKYLDETANPPAGVWISLDKAMN